MSWLNEEMNPQAKILGQIANPQMKRTDIALNYASCIRQRDPIDWPRVNGAITERWSLSGLSYIKRLAWKELRTPEATHCRECGCTLTPQEATICSVCYAILTEPES